MRRDAIGGGIAGKAPLTGALAIILLSLCAGASASAVRPAPVSYEIQPVLQGGALISLQVSLTLRGDADGETRLRLPSGGVADDERAAYLGGLTVEGAREYSETPRTLIVRHSPGSVLTIHYALASGYEGAPRRQPFRPVVMPDWFAVHGTAAFLIPEGRDRAPARLRWTALPGAWMATSSLPHEATLATLEDSFLFGGAGWRLVEGAGDGPPLKLYYRDAGWRVSPALAAPLLSRVFAADFAYWNDRPHPMVVPVIQIAGGDFGGRGLNGGFLIAAGPDADLREFGRIFAHEHTHGWISRQVGGFPETEDNLSAWFNEGFTEAVAARSLLRSRLWTLEAFAADLNESLLRYGLSPVAEAPNRLIQAERGISFDVDKLAYDRGRLLAILWDRRLRSASGDRLGLDAVLQAQRRLATENDRAGHRIPANALLPVAVRHVGGQDIGPDLDAYVEAGRRIELPADLFGDCGVIERVDQPAFDRGFDLKATLANDRRVRGLVSGGPAARAGLREGERIRVNEIPSHDSQTPLTYRVLEPGGGEHTIRYNPEGAGRVAFQRFVLRPDMDAAARERCRLMLSGGA